MKKISSEQIFQTELEVLRHGYHILHQYQDREPNLAQKYKELLYNYEKLLKLTKRIFKISDYQGVVLKNREVALKNLLDNSDQGFLTVNRKLLVNPEYSAKCRQLFGEKIEHKPIDQLLFKDDVDQRLQVEEVLDRLFECSDPRVMEKLLQQLPRCITCNGRQIKVEYKFFPVDLDNDEAYLMLFLSDVTEQLIAQARIEYLSCYDALTSVYNRSYIMQKWPSLLEKYNLPLSIILCDMNGLKLVNDVFGHEKGDRLIVNAAKVLKRSCRKSDLICRWGGDEFLVILPKTDREECQIIRQRINKACAETEIDLIAVSLSIGTATVDRTDVQFSEVFREAEVKMYKEKLLLSKEVSKNIIANINTNLEQKGFETAEHLKRLRFLVVNFARSLGIRDYSTDMDNLISLANLHDIGKILIPVEIYFKVGDLTAEEWEIIKSHSETGYKMAHSIGEPVIAEAILGIHEWWDGSGYPNGCKGDTIPYYSRIFSIVEAYDVMTHDTVYKKAKNQEEAMEELRSMKGIQFDPLLTEKFITVVNGKKIS